MDESPFSVRGKTTDPERERESEGDWKGEKVLSVRAAKSLRALNKCYLTLEVVEQVPRVFLRVLVVVRWLFTSELSLLSSFYLRLSFSFLLWVSPSVFSILHHQPPILHLHTSVRDILPYREHIKKMYSAVVNHTHPIFSEMRWDEEETTHWIQRWFMYIQKDRDVLSTRTGVKLIEILICINSVAWYLPDLTFGSTTERRQVAFSWGDSVRENKRVREINDVGPASIKLVYVWTC